MPCGRKVRKFGRGVSEMIKTNRFFLILISLTIPIALPALAQQPQQSAKRVPTVDALINVQTTGGARISPDGKWVAYTVNSADLNQDAFSTQLWVSETATGKKLQLTKGPGSSGTPRWSPDSQWLA